MVFFIHQLDNMPNAKHYHYYWDLQMAKKNPSALPSLPYKWMTQQSISVLSGNTGVTEMTVEDNKNMTSIKSTTCSELRKIP